MKAGSVCPGSYSKSTFPIKQETIFKIPYDKNKSGKIIHKTEVNFLQVSVQHYHVLYKQEPTDKVKSELEKFVNGDYSCHSVS